MSSQQIELLERARHQVLVGTDARTALSEVIGALPANAFVARRLELSLKLGVSVGALLDEQIWLLREDSRTQRELTRLYATPKLTANLILWLPAGGAVFGQVLGLGPLSFLLFHPVGCVVLALGLALNFAGWRWTRRLLADPRVRLDLEPTQEYLLLGDCLAAGVSVRAGLDLLAQSGVAPSKQLSDLLIAQRSQGYPLVPLLMSQASRLRDLAVDQVRDLLESLPNRLLLPIGLALLPAFLLLNVVPAAATALLVYR